ncbi:MAG: glycosyltransferase family 2 protein [Elusimicrobia bacterium]|nr:glycosyltransferase family 2 protein [Candidatus Liberimonas magnetica]
MKEKLLVIGSPDKKHQPLDWLSKHYELYFIYHSKDSFSQDTSELFLNKLGVHIVKNTRSDLLPLQELFSNHKFKAVLIFEKNCIYLKKLIRIIRVYSNYIKIAVLSHNIFPAFYKNSRHIEDFIEELKAYKLSCYALADCVFAGTKKEVKALKDVSNKINASLILKNKLIHFIDGSRQPDASRIKELTSIIIPCFNQLFYTKKCLESIRQNTNLPYEIITIDNGSKDRTPEYLDSYPNIKLITNKTNLGFAPACNQGIKAAKGSFLIILNNDTIVTPGWLERLITCAQSDRSIGLVGPCTNITHGFQKVQSIHFTNLKELYRWSNIFCINNYGNWYNVLWLNAFCILIKRELINKIGLFDENFTRGGYEDYDYCIRARKLKYKLFCCNDSFVYHYGTKSYSKKDNFNNLVKNSKVFLKKWGIDYFEYLRDTVWHSFSNIK